MKQAHIYTAIIFLIIGFGTGWYVQKTPTSTHENMTGMSMQHTMDGMTDGLANKKGDAFDEAFLNEMIIHHEGAVSMAQMVLAQSTRPELLTLAKNIITAQTTEIDMMQNWKQTWFKK